MTECYQQLHKNPFVNQDHHNMNNAAEHKQHWHRLQDSNVTYLMEVVIVFRWHQLSWKLKSVNTIVQGTAPICFLTAKYTMLMLQL